MTSDPTAGRHTPHARAPCSKVVALLADYLDLPGFHPSGIENIAAFAASTPGRIPLVGQLPGIDGVYLAVPSTDGFLMAAVLAEMTAELVVSGTRHSLMERSPLAQVNTG